MAKEIEFRAYSLIETKTSEAGGKFTGYAATYGRDAYGDRIAPGAFAESIKERRGKIPILVNHNPDDVVGFSTDLAEDAKGLYIAGVLSLGSSRAADIYAVMQTAESVDYKMGLSIGFMTEEAEYDDSTGFRTLNKISLFETSFTVFPANRQARVESLKSVRNVEQILRDVGGCSRETARRTLSLLQPYLLVGASGNPPQDSECDARTKRQQMMAATLAVIKEQTNGSSH